MNGTIVDERGMEDVRRHRALNVNAGLPPTPIERSLKGRIAVVGYGPSLNQTWERIKGFDTIISTSKAHEFLLDKGIKPTFHMDLDSRMHKVEFMQRPQMGTKYFLSSHVHPAYVEKMKTAKVDVSMFHVQIEKHVKLDPRYPCLPPRFDVGVQAAEWAFQNGYREQHWFGIEYGCATDGETHAGKHWGVPHPVDQRITVDVDGRHFVTTPLFFHGILLAEHFLCDRALVKCTIHGDGLLGHFLRARNRVRPKVLI